MKIITRNLLLFASLLFIYTLLFRYGLGAFLDAEKYTWVIVISVLYSAIIFVTAWTAGRRDGKENFLFDAGFRWNLCTWTVWGIASEGWFLLGLHSAQESIQVVHIILAIWSCFLLLHFILFLILRRKTIKGVHKTDIFD